VAIKILALDQHHASFSYRYCFNTSLVDCCTLCCSGRLRWHKGRGQENQACDEFHGERFEMWSMIQYRVLAKNPSESFETYMSSHSGDWIIRFRSKSSPLRHEECETFETYEQRSHYSQVVGIGATLDGFRSISGKLKPLSIVVNTTVPGIYWLRLKLLWMITHNY